MFSVERRPDFDGLQCCRTPPALDFHLTFQSSRRVTFDTFYPPPPFSNLAQRSHINIDRVELHRSCEAWGAYWKNI